jgi:hypothetical protein
MGLYALWLVAGSFVLLWLLSVCGVIATGGWVHLLLIAAMAMTAGTLFTRPRPI